MAERQLPKLNVAGSIPVSRSKNINSLQLLDRRLPAFDRRLRIDVLVDTETVPELIGD